MPPALTVQPFRQIDSALAAVGDCGEARLIVENGKLRYSQQLTREAAATTNRDLRQLPGFSCGGRRRCDHFTARSSRQSDGTG